MKFSFQSIVLIGAAHRIVSLIEFFVDGKASGSLLLATFLLAVGFGGLFIYERVKK
jgi:hypothetical protein